MRAMGSQTIFQLNNSQQGKQHEVAMPFTFMDREHTELLSAWCCVLGLWGGSR